MLRRTLPGVKLGHLPPILLCGTNSSHLIRALCEVSSWLDQVMASEDGHISGAFVEAIRVIKELGGGPAQPQYKTVHQLPTKWDSILHTAAISSSGWDDLPSLVLPLDTDRESRVISILLQGLNLNLACDLDPRPDPARTIGAGVGVFSRCKFLVIGDQGASRLITELENQGTVAGGVTADNFRVTVSGVAQTMTKTREVLARVKPELVVLMGLDSSVFYGVVDGEVNLPIREDNGAIHIKGELRVLGKDAQYEIFKQILPLLTVAGKRPVILVTPFSRWLLGRCCEEKDHITNFNDMEYETTLATQLLELARNFRSFCFTKGMREVRILDPFTLTKELPKIELWEDSVTYPSTRFYSKMAEKIIFMASSKEEKAGQAPNNSSGQRSAHGSGQQLPPNSPHPQGHATGGGPEQQQWRGGYTHRGGRRGHRGAHPYRRN